MLGVRGIDKDGEMKGGEDGLWRLGDGGWEMEGERWGMEEVGGREEGGILRGLMAVGDGERLYFLSLWFQRKYHKAIDQNCGAVCTENSVVLSFVLRVRR